MTRLFNHRTSLEFDFTLLLSNCTVITLYCTAVTFLNVKN